MTLIIPIRMKVTLANIIQNWMTFIIQIIIKNWMTFIIQIEMKVTVDNSIQNWMTVNICSWMSFIIMAKQNRMTLM